MIFSIMLNPSGQEGAADNLGQFRVQAPSEYQEHELVANRLFYTVPRKLIDLLSRAPHRSRLAPELLGLELAMTEAAGSACGYWDGRAIRSIWLNPPPPLQTIDVQGEDIPGWTVADKAAIAADAKLIDEKLMAQRTPAVGYLGWLLTNNTFLDEHDELCRRHEALLKNSGMLRMGTVGRTSSFQQEQSQVSNEGNFAEEFDIVATVQDNPHVQGTPPNTDNGQTNARTFTVFLEEFTALYIRWRLQDCDGPYLPSPLTQQLPVQHLSAMLGHMKEGGRSFYFPDTLPIPSRDVLRALIEESLRHRSSSPVHLAEWQNLIDGSQTAKNQLSRYARLFPLQHYIRELHTRHGSFLRNSRIHLRDAFGEYFGLSSATIEADLAFIDKRLGRGWESQPRVFMNPP
jgi:hypothetical protein